MLKKPCVEAGRQSNVPSMLEHTLVLCSQGQHAQQAVTANDQEHTPHLRRLHSLQRTKHRTTSPTLLRTSLESSGLKKSRWPQLSKKPSLSRHPRKEPSPNTLRSVKPPPSPDCHQTRHLGCSGKLRRRGSLSSPFEKIPRSEVPWRNLHQANSPADSRQHHQQTPPPTSSQRNQPHFSVDSATSCFFLEWTTTQQYEEIHWIANARESAAGTGRHFFRPFGAERSSNSECISICSAVRLPSGLQQTWHRFLVCSHQSSARSK